MFKVRLENRLNFLTKQMSEPILRRDWELEDKGENVLVNTQGWIGKKNKVSSLVEHLSSKHSAFDPQFQNRRARKSKVVPEDGE